MKSTRLKVKGRVQGVGFRQNVKAAADSRGVMGYAANQKDGSVDVVLQGGERQVEEIIDTIETSPAYADVKAVEREEVDVPGYTGFEIRTDIGNVQRSRYEARAG